MSEQKDKMKGILINFPTSTISKLQKLNDATHVPVSRIIRDAVDAYIIQKAALLEEEKGKKEL